jgi:phosphotransferase system  glucose/maltose/N-acetylglucosamine-specific IIC component
MTIILAFTAAGVLATVGTLLAVLGDKRGQRASGFNGKDAYIVNGDLISEAHRLAKHLIVAGLCFYLAHIVATYPLTEAGRHALRIVLGGLVTISWLMTENSLLDLYRRHFSKHGPRLRGKHP